MSLSAKLTSEYKELVNNYLWHLPISKFSDFVVISQALETIINANSKFVIPRYIKADIAPISELIDEPELYAAPTDIEEFKKIVLAQVAAKMKEFQKISEQEMNRYINDQYIAHRDVNDHKQLMASSTPPAQGTEAHTIPVRQMLEEADREWQLREIAQITLHAVAREGSSNLAILSENINALRTQLLRAIVDEAHNFATQLAEQETEEEDYYTTTATPQQREIVASHNFPLPQLFPQTDSDFIRNLDEQASQFFHEPRLSAAGLRLNLINAIIDDVD